MDAGPKPGVTAPNPKLMPTEEQREMGCQGPGLPQDTEVPGPPL